MGWSGGASGSVNSASGNHAGSAVPRPGGATGDTIEMDPQFGQAIGLRAGQKVTHTCKLGRRKKKIESFSRSEDC